MKNKIIIGAIVVIAIIFIFSLISKDNSNVANTLEETNTIEEPEYSYVEPDEEGFVIVESIVTEEGYNPQFPE